jgi:hypothetical protein
MFPFHYKNPEKRQHHLQRQQRSYERKQNKIMGKVPIPIIFPVERDYRDLKPFQRLLFIFAVYTCVMSSVGTAAKNSAIVENTNANSFDPIDDAAFLPLSTNSTTCPTRHALTVTPRFPRYVPYLKDGLFPAKDITSLEKKCWRKSEGRVAGGVCHIDNKIYYIKETNQLRSDSLGARYNFLLAKYNMDIVVPKVTFFYQAHHHSNDRRGHFYLASEKMDFNSAHQFKSSGINFWLFPDNIVSEKLMAKLDKVEIAKLGVASTFFTDMTAGNWGYNTQRKLTLVDLDFSPDMLYREYSYSFPMLEQEYSFYFPNPLRPYYSAQRTERLFNDVHLELSLDNIIEMQKIYMSMLTIPVPKLHPTVDMSPEMYNTLLEVFIKACAKVMNYFHQQDSSSNKKMNHSHPFWSVTKKLKQEIYETGHAIEVEKGLRRSIFFI